MVQYELCHVDILRDTKRYTSIFNVQIALRYIADISVGRSAIYRRNISHISL